MAQLVTMIDQRTQRHHSVVDHGLAVGDQALREMAADALAALDRPHPLRMPATGGQHAVVAVLVGAEPTGVQHVLAFVDDLDGGGPLVRIHADY
ncbi:hypothetical protein AB0F52_28285 [Amycolatopsis sp. NPDC024027]|uniref:hypothetical protein n=1 Tax=Amycolatopsis sp. NPDC024027 TaxID=3154327 RepID=UPI0033E59567